MLRREIDELFFYCLYIDIVAVFPKTDIIPEDKIVAFCLQSTAEFTFKLIGVLLYILCSV